MKRFVLASVFALGLAVAVHAESMVEILDVALPGGCGGYSGTHWNVTAWGYGGFQQIGFYHGSLSPFHGGSASEVPFSTLGISAGDAPNYDSYTIDCN